MAVKDLFKRPVEETEDVPGAATSLIGNTQVGSGVRLLIHGAATPNPSGGIFGSIGSGAADSGYSAPGSFFGNVLKGAIVTKAKALHDLTKAREAAELATGEAKKSGLTKLQLMKKKTEADLTQTVGVSSAETAEIVGKQVQEEPVVTPEDPRTKRIRAKAEERAKKRVGSTYDYKAGAAQKQKLIKKETDRHMAGDLKDTL